MQPALAESSETSDGAGTSISFLLLLLLLLLLLQVFVLLPYSSIYVIGG
jgi:hypothetical protein